MKNVSKTVLTGAAILMVMGYSVSAMDLSDRRQSTNVVDIRSETFGLPSNPTFVVDEVTKADTVAANMIALQANYERVCELYSQNKVVLSKNGVLACDGSSKHQPVPYKNGTRYKKARSGAEINTIIANMSFFE